MVIEGVADKLAKYFTGHLVAPWRNFGCNFMGSEPLKLPEKVSRHLVAFLVGMVSSNKEIYSLRAYEHQFRDCPHVLKVKFGSVSSSSYVLMLKKS